MLHSAACYYQWTEKSMEYLSPLFSWQVFNYFFFFFGSTLCFNPFFPF